MNRRAFVSGAAWMLGAARIAAGREGEPAAAHRVGDEFAYAEWQISQMQRAFAAGTLSAERLTRAYLDRIERLDRSGPRVNALIELNPDALQQARVADRERARSSGPLHGIPVLIKDNIGTRDRMKTSAGSLALAQHHAGRDAFLVERLRKQGAVILGKTNLSEWANFRSPHSTSGWSGRGGLTRNPYVLDRTACGSSSGSGAAVAANFCAVAVGTETDGSIVCPSSMNGLVGIKPTIGLISRSGIIPISHSQDTAGPMTRTVRDAAILLSVLAGTDAADPATMRPEVRRSEDYTQFLNPRALRGARIGVTRKFFGISAAYDRILAECLDVMRQQGAEMVDPADLPASSPLAPSEMEVLLYDFKADLNRYLSSADNTSDMKSLADVIAFNQRERAREMPFFEQELFHDAQKKGPLTEKAYLNAVATNRRLSRTEGIDAAVSKFRVDALVAPTAGPAWVIDLLNGDHDSGGCSTPPAVAGYPHITVPAGFLEGLPVGISFFGPAWSEPKLLGLAYAFEQAAAVRKPPKFLPRLPLI